MKPRREGWLLCVGSTSPRVTPSLALAVFPCQQLKAIAVTFQSHLSPPRDGTDRINYDDFCVMAGVVKDTISASAAAQFFTATNFLKVLGLVM